MDWIGVDGCRAGWFAAHMTTDGFFHGSVHPSISSLRDAYPERGVLIDVPIGLVADSSGGRACDSEARRALGGDRASSVFTAPTRAATRVDSYEEGSAINASLTGKKLSRQAWGIVPKIAEVDAYLLAADSSERAAVREVHPEVLFWALSGRTSMTHRKSVAEGIEERLEVLERFAPRVREAYTECLDSWPRSQVARDDVLDAFAAAVTGHLGGEHLSTLPTTPEHDGHGLPMEMVYWLAGDRPLVEPAGRFCLRARLADLTKYARRYDADSDVPIERFLQASLTIGELGSDDLLELVAWKSPRPLPLAKENSDDFVRTVTRASLGASNERFRIESLTLLRGVSWPTASVILHLCTRDDYPILDFRALWTLGIDESATYDFHLWWEYVVTFRDLMSQTGLNARDMDRALWQYSKEHQPRGSRSE